MNKKPLVDGRVLDVRFEEPHVIFRLLRNGGFETPKLQLTEEDWRRIGQGRLIDTYWRGDPCVGFRVVSALKMIPRKQLGMPIGQRDLPLIEFDAVEKMVKAIAKWED